jgi:hypothetical protein
MARALYCNGTLCALLLAASTLQAAETATLREDPKPGVITAALVEMTAEGTYIPPVPEGAPAAKPLELKVQTRLDLAERILLVSGGKASRVARKVNQAASAINGKVRPFASSLRPEVSLLVTAWRDGSVVTFSPGGPLTRSELELVQAPGDPLSLPELLPGKEIGVGDSWPIVSEAARSLSGYDALASNSLKAKVEALNAETATMKLAGEVRGAENGAEGQITFDGSFTFDRKTSLIIHFEVKRSEVRKAGPVGAGLDVKSTLTVDRKPVEAPGELSDEALSGVPTEPAAERLLLQYSPPEGKYTFLHDRDWHLYWDDTRLAVLKKLDRGDVIAQCNLSMGPNAGPGRHQDPKQFQADVRKALGTRFSQFLGGGEIEGSEPGGYRYKLSVQGREQQLDVVWQYYLIAGPQGDQVLATFTLAADGLKRFGNQDSQMIGSLQWRTEPPKAD